MEENFRSSLFAYYIFGLPFSLSLFLSSLFHFCFSSFLLSFSLAFLLTGRVKIAKNNFAGKTDENWIVEEPNSRRTELLKNRIHAEPNSRRIEMLKNRNAEDPNCWRFELMTDRNNEDRINKDRINKETNRWRPELMKKTNRWRSELMKTVLMKDRINEEPN